MASKPNTTPPAATEAMETSVSPHCVPMSSERLPGQTYIFQGYLRS